MSTEFIESNILSNRIQSAILIFAMTCILALLGFLLGGPTGAVVAVGICLLAIVFGPVVSPQIVLRMYKAQPIPRQTSPQMFDLFAELIHRAGLQQAPTLYYIPSRTLNAFAVGSKEHASVAITDGLLRILNPREIAGVLAHEVSHIRHKDMWVLAIADTVSRIIGSLSQIGQIMLLLAVPHYLINGGYLLLALALLLMLSPLISNFLQLALSRSREFNADLGAVVLTRDAAGLASALAKLERITSGTGSPWIIPGSKSQTVPAVLRTHPPTDERIRRILAAGESLQGTTPALELEGPLEPRRLAPSDHARVRQGPGWHIAGLWY
jgi:heat shock protein HtpX